MNSRNRAWLVALSAFVIGAWPYATFAQSDSEGAYRVRIIYLIPSNRQLQPDAQQILQRFALRTQTLYRENMARQGYGDKTFSFETEADGTMPKVNIAHVPQADSQFQDPDYLKRWGNILNGTAAAGFPVFRNGEALWVIPEMHQQLADGTFLDSGEFAGGIGNGVTGFAAVSSDFMARMPASFLTDDSAYVGLVIPTLGAFPLTGDSFPWYEGGTVSSISSSAQGDAAHEVGHTFALPHDFTNDDNFFGNLMGRGARGFRGFFYPERYPDSYVDLSAATALHLNNSPFFNAPVPEIFGPAAAIERADVVAGQIRFTFYASGYGLAGAVLRRNGSAVASMPLTGTFVTASISSYDYTPGVTDTWELLVYDGRSLSYGRSSMSFTPPFGINRAPFPHVHVSKGHVLAGEVVTLDASSSIDPDGATSEMGVEWDLNGDGIFDTLPSSAMKLDTSFAGPGVYQITARLTDANGDTSISSAIGIQVEPPNVNGLVTLDVSDSRFTSDATGCPAGYAGKSSIDALLTNRSEVKLSGMKFGIARLTEGALLLGTKAVYEEGQFLKVPGLPNQQLDPGQSVSVPFTLCLEKTSQVDFLVSVHAVPSDSMPR